MPHIGRHEAPFGNDNAGATPLHHHHGDSSAKFREQLNKEPSKLPGNHLRDDSHPTNSGISTLPKVAFHGHEGGNRFVPTTKGGHKSDGGDFSDTQKHHRIEASDDTRSTVIVKHVESRKHGGKDTPGERTVKTTHPTSDGKDGVQNGKSKEMEEHPRGGKEKKEKHPKSRVDDEDGRGDKKKHQVDGKENEDAELKGREHPHIEKMHHKREHIGPYVNQEGMQNPYADPRINEIGKAIINAEKSSDNFQLMKSVQGMKEPDIRQQFQHAQSVINNDLNNQSVRIGVDENNIHIYFKRTDLTLLYSAATDKKMAPDVNDPAVRKELTDRLAQNVGAGWRAELGKLSTSELAIFDAISRSDGPALRSAMSNIKSTEELEDRFQHISQFAYNRGLSNWGNIIWSNDLKSLTVYNGTTLFTGAFPIE